MGVTAIIIYLAAHFGAISWAPATVNVAAAGVTTAELIGNEIAHDIAEEREREQGN